RGMLPDLVRAGGLVDADRAHRAAVLLEDVAADPADVVRHLFVADLAGAGRRLLELFRRAPAAAAKDHVRVHRASSDWGTAAVNRLGQLRSSGLAQPGERLARGRLLGILLRAARPDAGLLAVDHR